MTRKFVSLTLLFSFFLLALSSVVLYVVPEGRVASWADWSVLMLGKEQWGAVHITGGTLFLIFSLWHMALNIRPLKSYLSAARGRAALAGSLLLCVLCYAATVAEMQPVQFLIDLNQNIKTAQEAKHGAPPYGHAETSSLTEFCTFMRLDEIAVTEGLKAAGLGGVNPGSTLADIASANGISPAELYRRILDIPGMEPAPVASGSGKGRGRRLLDQNAGQNMN